MLEMMYNVKSSQTVSWCVGVFIIWVDPKAFVLEVVAQSCLTVVHLSMARHCLQISVIPIDGLLLPVS